MADVQIPEGLLALRKSFLAAQGRWKTAGETLPSPAAVAAGEAEPASDVQRQEWLDAQEECRRIAKEIDESPDWAAVTDRKAVRKALDNVTG